MTTTEKDFFDAWTGFAVKAAEGLDLNDADDRAIFRSRFAERTRNLRVSALILLAAEWGSPQPGNASRSDACRAVADAWIARSQS
jgi:hypothetical protein